MFDAKLAYLANLIKDIPEGDSADFYKRAVWGVPPAEDKEKETIKGCIKMLSAEEDLRAKLDVITITLTRKDAALLGELLGKFNFYTVGALLSGNGHDEDYFYDAMRAVTHTYAAIANTLPITENNAKE